MTGEQTPTGPSRWVGVTTLVANLAVLVGLGLVLLELRQNDRVLAATVQLSLSSAYQEIASRPIENVEFAATVRRMFVAPDSLSDVEVVQAVNWISEWGAVLFAAYELREAGAISEETWHQHARNFALFFESPWFRDSVVSGFSDLYPPEFVAEFERLAPSPKGTR